MVFGGAQVLMDIEPLIGILQENAILHGDTHTLAGAAVIGLAAALTGRPISALVLRLLTIPHYPFTWLVCFTGAFMGTFSHIGFDAVMHSDMNPWWPLAQGNGLLAIIPVGLLHMLCFGLGIVGSVIIAIRASRNGRA